MDNKFFTFIKPWLSYIDNGHLYRKPFSWLYVLFAIGNLIIPIYFFYLAIENNIFSAPASIIVVFLLVWVAIAFAGWVSFQLWWDRKSKVIATSTDMDEFVATPVFSHLIQTVGEWLGTWIGIVGFAMAVLITLFLGEDGYFLSSQLGLGFIGTSFISIVMMPVYGFLIIVTTRFLAEQFRSLAAIANNTRKN